MPDGSPVQITGTGGERADWSLAQGLLALVPCRLQQPRRPSRLSPSGALILPPLLLLARPAESAADRCRPRYYWQGRALSSSASSRASSVASRSCGPRLRRSSPFPSHLTTTTTTTAANPPYASSRFRGGGGSSVAPAAKTTRALLGLALRTRAGIVQCSQTTATAQLPGTLRLLAGPAPAFAMPRSSLYGGMVGEQAELKCESLKLFSLSIL